MLDVTAKDISELGDEDLRTLIASLCEAEIRAANFPVSAVTAGGHQNAADGGLDVRVRLDSASKCEGFVPKPNTGFQVKVSDMPRAAILDEMAPRGTLRPVISELASAEGAYIIVSSKATVSDTMLRTRLVAMADALAGLPDPTKLHLDFYDSDRVARWARSFPGVSAWVRAKVGRPLQGWLPFGSWSAPSAPESEKYLVDDQARIRDGRDRSNDELSIEDGINRIREVLAREKGVVRLIGLSGLGKTRLVQALFDAEIGASALDPALVVYTDMAHDPQPSPRDLAHSFAESRKRAIVVVDNCRPETHKALVAVCGTRDSRTSLITIEYDVGEDEPEDTNVFRLAPASDNVIEKLVIARFPDVSQVDVRRLVEFSGGNARVALALARTVRKSDEVSKLADRELFGRLFHQGNSEDRALLRAAEACSLVYSFNGEAIDGDQAELPILANLAGQSVTDFYRHVAELRRRDLVQRRGKWRALLPHALANKMAVQMLDQSLPAKIESELVSRGTERLAKSFSRRLGYLHDCDSVRKLVESWLNEGGVLGSPHTFTSLDWTMFENVAPILPEKTLETIERSVSSEGRVIITDVAHPARRHLPSLLRSLAYEASMFDRSARLLRELILAEPPDHSLDSARDAFNELFRLYLSGTHAKFAQRADIIRDLLNGGNDRAVQRGLDALAHLLDAGHFTSSHRFEFGARSRDYGWIPRTIGERADWYRSAISLLIDFWRSRIELREQIKTIFANKLRMLWTRSHIVAELESAIDTFSKEDGWIEGWLSVKEIIRFDRKNMPAPMLAILLKVEERLRPKNLIDLTRAYALSDSWKAIDVSADEADPVSPLVYAAAETRTFELGEAVVQDRAVLQSVLPKLLSGQEAGRRFSFGKGIASGANDLDEMWSLLLDGLRAVPADQRNIGVLLGFLNRAQLISPEFVDSALDTAVRDSLLSFWFPTLQGAVPIDDKAADRLIKALQHGTAQLHRYNYFPIRESSPISPAKINAFLVALANQPDGALLAIDIIHLHMHSLKDAKRSIPLELRACGRQLLEMIVPSKITANDDYKVGAVMEHCLVGEEAKACAVALCQKVLSVRSRDRSSIYDAGEFLLGIFRWQPNIALESFFGEDRRERIRWIFDDWGHGKRSPLDVVPVEKVIAWAAKDPTARYPRLAQCVTLFQHGDGEGDQKLTSNSIALLDACPDKSAVMTAFQDRLRPTMWSGSLALILNRRAEALGVLVSHTDSLVSAWASRSRDQLLDQARNERAFVREEDESFE